ncbi:MAG: helix-turn-helix transcriptional regulator [Pigmentiphaga sp.]|nr:helix-turn-helix transcriptional regulator [Pigmentiphaga sp.]
MDRTRHDKLLSLSRNERVVLKLLLTGMSNEAIGLDQDISINTVKTYRKRLYKKLEVSTVNELHSRYGNLA